MDKEKMWVLYLLVGIGFDSNGQFSKKVQNSLIENITKG